MMGTGIRPVAMGWMACQPRGWRCGQRCGTVVDVHGYIHIARGNKSQCLYGHVGINISTRIIEARPRGDHCFLSGAVLVTRTHRLSCIRNVSLSMNANRCQVDASLHLHTCSYGGAKSGLGPQQGKVNVAGIMALCLAAKMVAGNLTRNLGPCLAPCPLKNMLTRNHRHK